MKKVNLLAIIAIVLAAAAAVAVWFFCFGNRGEEDTETALLNCSTVFDVEEYISAHGIETYELSTDFCAVNGVSLFGADAEVEFAIENEAVSRIRVKYTLFQDAFEELGETDLETYDITQYRFSQEDKEYIEKAFNDLKERFEQYVGGTLEQYDLLPAQEGVSTEENEELFYQGLQIKEYSVRDRNGVLWLLRYQAAYGMAHATLMKIVDDFDYEGFIPGVDLTKA